jgi:DNA transformation protein
MALSAGLREYLFDVLAPLGKIETRSFFGTDGIKVDGAMVGFVLDDKIYLRTDAQSRTSYMDEGGEAFTFEMNGETVVTSYYTIPDRLHDESDELLSWVRIARAAALEAPSAKKRRARNERKARTAEAPKRKRSTARRSAKR